MKRKYDLVANLYLDLFEKKENYQNHIRALSTGSSVIEDKQPDPPARLASRKNHYMEIQKKIFQLGIENSRAVSCLSNYSKYNNPKIIQPGSKQNPNQITRVDWLKPYNSTPLPSLQSNQNQILFKKNNKSNQNDQTEDKTKNNYIKDSKLNKISKSDEQEKSNKISKDNKNNDQTKVDQILYLTEPEGSEQVDK